MADPLRVLLVEDLEEDALILVRELRRGGYDPCFERVETDEALRAALARQRWDLILADYALPHFSAPAALAAVRELALDVPFLVVSGRIGEETAVAMMRAGAHDYLMKDNLVRLLPAIGRELREAEDRRARRWAEQEREALRQLHETVLTTMPSALLVLDAELRVLMANRRYLEEQGLEPRAVAGKSILELPPRALLTQAPLMDRIRAAAEAGSGDELLGLRVPSGKRPDSYFNVWVCGIQPAAGEGAEAGTRVLLIVEDVTKQRMFEEQAHQLANFESLGRLAGGIAHDFNNMLTGIIGFAQLSLSAVPSGSPVAHHLDQIYQLGQRAARLTRQIMAFGRKQLLQPCVVNLNRVVKVSLDLLRQLVGDNISVQFLPAPDLGNVCVDVSQIGQVLTNLAVNARDAMPTGGTLTIETANVVLDRAYADEHVGTKPGPYVQMTVSDTGCGIAPAIIERIFEPFFTTKGVGEGSGLGLAAVYGIVKQHGGNVWGYSEPGRGATFKVYLPRVEGSDEAPPPEARASKVREVMDAPEGA